MFPLISIINQLIIRSKVQDKPKDRFPQCWIDIIGNLTGITVQHKIEEHSVCYMITKIINQESVLVNYRFRSYDSFSGLSSTRNNEYIQ